MSSIEERLRLLEEFYQDYMAGKLPSRAALGPGVIEAQHLKANAVTAEKIVSGQGVINDLTLKSTLTLGDGGKIVDADGSEWNQNGIKLAGPSSNADVISIERTGYDPLAKMTAYIQTGLANFYLDARVHPSNIDNYGAALQFSASTTLGGMSYLEARRGNGGGNYIPTWIAVYSMPASSPRPAGGYISMNDQSGSVRFFIGSVVDDTMAGNMGTKNIFINNAGAAPSGNPTGGGFLWVEGGALKYRGSGGTVTTIAAA